MVGLSLAEKRFIQGGIAQNLRSDGRGREDFRSFSIECGVIPQANGSARVRIGSTDVIATVKADLGKPSPYKPDQGKIEIGVECSSTAAPEFEAALSNTCIPKDEVVPGTSPDQLEDVGISDEEFSHLDTSRVPVIVTLTKVGMAYIVDVTLEEESHMSSAVSVSVNKLGHVCGLTKRGGAGLDPSVVLAMISVAKHVGQRLITLVDSEIAAAEARITDDQL